MTDEEVADLVQAGWIPPPPLWLSPSEAVDGEVVLVWLVEDGEPFASGMAEFAYLDGEQWTDLDEDNIEAGSMRVRGIAPTPHAGLEMAPAAERLLRKYCSLERKGKLPPPSKAVE
jgi:hypothetical protein